MQTSGIQKITYGEEFQMGPLRIRQPLPVQGLETVGPFILLHHAVPTYYEPGGERPRLGPHPHRGFEPVTFIFEGGAYHRDSLGNEGFLEAGDVQWMTAGKGIIHSEGPSETFLQRGGTLELVQLWVNLPAKHKMTEPGYQDIKAGQIPLVFDEKGVDLKIVSGEYNGRIGPAKTFTPMITLFGKVEKGKKLFFNFPSGYETCIYLLKGEAEIFDTKVDRFHLIRLNDNLVNIEILSDTKMILLSGEPIHEPMVSHGPFVMNTHQEIHQAITDYHLGKMGSLDF